jgi:hypothetical protein
MAAADRAERMKRKDCDSLLMQQRKIHDSTLKHYRILLTGLMGAFVTLTGIVWTHGA